MYDKGVSVTRNLSKISLQHCMRRLIMAKSETDEDLILY
jgi:hypothetical protein